MPLASAFRGELMAALDFAVAGPQFHRGLASGICLSACRWRRSAGCVVSIGWRWLARSGEAKGLKG